MDEKLAHIENLLDYIPYNKLINRSKNFEEDFLQYISGKYSILPELSSVMEFEQLLRMLYIFSGQSINIPDQKSILTAIRDLDIYYSLSENASSIEITRLAKKYSTTVQTVRSVYEKVVENLNKVPDTIA